MLHIDGFSLLVGLDEVREGAAVHQGAGVMRHGEAPMGACSPRGRRTPGVSARGALVWLATSLVTRKKDLHAWGLGRVRRRRSRAPLG